MKLAFKKFIEFFSNDESSMIIPLFFLIFVVLGINFSLAYNNLFVEQNFSVFSIVFELFRLFVCCYIVHIAIKLKKSYENLFNVRKKSQEIRKEIYSRIKEE